MVKYVLTEKTVKKLIMAYVTVLFFFLLVSVHGRCIVL